MACSQRKHLHAGQVQAAIANVGDALKKTFNITPFNLTPIALADDPLFNPLHADDIIYGGLGDDFLSRWRG